MLEVEWRNEITRTKENQDPNHKESLGVITATRRVTERESALIRRRSQMISRNLVTH